MKNFQLLLLLCGMLCISHSSRADHCLGAEIHYNQLGLDTYLVTVIMYRDCNGTTFSTPTLSVSDCKKTKNYALKTGTITDITPVGPGSCTRCISSACPVGIGIQAVTFTGKIYTSAFSCCNLKLRFLGYPRNSGITTGSGGEGSYVETTLNHCAGPKNNTPTFTSPPLLIVPVNELVYYNPGAVDNDLDSSGRRDSLVYSLTSPMLDSSTKNSWTSSYDYNKPLNFVSFPKAGARWNPPSSPKGFHFDSLTGDMYFKPTSVMSSLLTYSIYTYGRNNAGNTYLKGIMNRSILIVVKSMPSKNEPDLSGINGGKSFDTVASPNTSLCFNIKSMVKDTSDSLTLSWNSGIPKGKFNVTKGMKQPIGTFCWMPDTSDISTYPYQFVVKAEDSYGGINQNAYKSYSVYVKQSIRDSISIVQKCYSVNFSVYKKTGSVAITNYQWYGDDSLSSTTTSFTHFYKKPGLYKYYLKTSGGKISNIDSGLILIGYPLSLSMVHDTAICSGSTYIINPALSGGGSPYSYLWNTGDTTSAISVTISKNISYYLAVKDAYNCTAMDTVNIQSNALPRVTISPDTSICKSSGNFPLLSLHPFPKGGRWSGIGIAADSLDPNVAGAGIDSVHYSYIDKVGCSNKALAKIKILAGPAIPLISRSVNDSLIASVKNEKYTWYRDGVLLSSHNDSIHVTQSGDYTVIVKDSFGCFAKSAPYSIILTEIESSTYKNDAIRIYPNPTNGLLKIEIKDNGMATAVLQNSIGVKVKVFKIAHLPQTTTLDLHTLPQGLYTLHIQSATGTYIEKIVLEK